MGMPDGDRIYGKLAQVWEGPYEQICEWYHSPQEIAGNLLKSLSTTLQRFGLEPVFYLTEAAHQLEMIPRDFSGKATANWREESRKLELLARKFSHKRAIDVAVKACKSYLRSLENGFGAFDHRQGLLREYVRWVYETEFEGKLPMDKHRDNVEHATFEERLREVDGYVLNELASIADHIVRTGKVKGYRRPSELLSHIDADTDLLANK